MARLLIKNVNAWHWTSMPTFSDHDPSTDVSGTSDCPPVEDESVFDRVIDAKGGILLPSLMDSHIHVGMVGETSTFLDLNECNSIMDLQVALRKHCRKLVASEGDQLDRSKLVIGVQWDQTQLSRFPTRHDLDEALQVGFREPDDAEDKGLENFSDIPVFLWRACWHIGVGSSKALRLLNVLPSEDNVTLDSATSLATLHHKWYDTPGGVIEEGVDGLPTGILKERATEMVFAYMKLKKTREDVKQHLKNGLQICRRNGLTAVHTNDDDALDLYKQLEDEIGLSVRVFLTPLITDLVAEKERSENQDIVKIYDKPYMSRYSNISNAENTSRCKYPHLYVDRIKIFSDGSLGAGTAAIRSTDVDMAANASQVGDGEGGYSNDSSHTGMLIYSDAELESMIGTAKSHGYRVEIHAIGDAAAGQVLRAMSRCGIVPADRAVLTHCQVLGADLLRQIKDMGVICNVQPSFVPTDMKWVQERLAAGSQDYAYIWKTLMRSSIHVAGGSDGPIEHCSPFLGMYDAIYREGRTAQHEVYKPDECLSFAEALYCYSVEGAYACQMEHVLGQIEVGFLGDFVLLSNTDTESPGCPGNEKNPVLNPRLLQSMVDRCLPVDGGGPSDSQQWIVVISGRVKTPLTATLLNVFDVATAPSHPAPTTVFQSVPSDSTVTVGGDSAPGKNGNADMMRHSNSRAAVGASIRPPGDLYCMVPSVPKRMRGTSMPQSDEVCKCCVLRNWLRSTHV